MDKRSKKLGESETSKIDFTKKALQKSITGRKSKILGSCDGNSKSIQNSCIAFYCQKFKGGLFGNCQKYYKTF